MKAFTLKENGGIENLAYAEIAVPTIQPHEVLVKVKAISINPVDAFVRQSNQALLNILEPKNGEDTFVLGWDISGTIEATGEDVTEFRKGEDVFGMINFSGHGKAYAEYIAAPVSHLALKPANISHDEAAAATLAALTAWQALVTHAKVQKGDKVLI
ncbi:MAG TPA: alcohol dehydrogenase catalytic domain-containing protein, partial [Cytophagales bacterium]|nr:alcohol dehydrogenase catalytic domain-containing protein [Cytophagales bacterium]